MTCEFRMGCGLGGGAEQSINYWLVMMSRAPRVFPRVWKTAPWQTPILGSLAQRRVDGDE